MDAKRTYAGVQHQRLRKAAHGAGTTIHWAQMRNCVTVGGRVMAVCEPVTNFGGWTKAAKFARFIAAANPATVLALLDRIEHLEGHLVAAEAAQPVGLDRAAIINTLQKSGATVVFDSKLGRDEYASVSASLPAIERFVRAIAQQPASAQPVRQQSGESK